MPKVSPGHLEARRRGILAAAQRCFARKGPSRTTMRDICRAANLSPGGVYRYFDGKSDILAALAAERQRQIDRFFRPLADHQLDRKLLLTSLEKLIAALDDDSARDGLQMDLHLWSAALASEAIREGVVEGNRTMVDKLAERLPGATAAESLALARLLLALLQGLAVQRALDPEIEFSSLLTRARRALTPGA